jgi:hypothetical protein
MTAWWKRNSNIVVKDSTEAGSTDDIPSSTDDEVEYTKAEVEDLTRCIPLLLDKCVRREKIDLRLDDFYDIIDKARGSYRR